MIILILIEVSGLESEATYQALFRKKSFELCWKLYPELGNSFVTQPATFSVLDVHSSAGVNSLWGKKPAPYPSVNAWVFKEGSIYLNL